MTSGMRHILSEAVLWLCVFIIALAAFFYLDDRLGAYMAQDAGKQSRASDTFPEANPTQKAPVNQHEPPQAQENSGYGRVVLHADRSGHFEVNAYINERSVNLIADTGATSVVLTYADAQTLGLAYGLQFTGRARTANGISKIAPIMLESIEVGDIQIDNVKAYVAEEGAMFQSLLGMSFIGRLERFEMSGRELILIQ